MPAFELRPAIRENVPLIIGIAGGTGAGKTYSAFLMAKGMAGGQRFAVIDTESGRAKAYADDFSFDQGELVAPFRPDAYANAIQAVDALKKYSVIVVDSCSHEYAGDGGILDWQEEELNAMVRRAMERQSENRKEWELREAFKMRSWIEPKMSHKSFMTKLLQIRAHLILCFRAESKTEMAKDSHGKTVIREKQGLTGLNGWFPICEKTMPYELTAYFLLMADKPGVPLPIKLMEKHKPFFPTGVAISEESGRKLAEWARGGTSSGVATGVAGEPQRGLGAPPTPENLTGDDIRDIETACQDAGAKVADLLAWIVTKLPEVKTLADVPREKLPSLNQWIAKRKTA